MAVAGPDLVEAIRQLTQLLGECRQAVVFTGAGISTESGIPDFRSPGGVWSRRQPVMFEDFLESEAARRASWELKFEFDDSMKDAKPNRGHLAIADLVRRGVVSHVVTQNIDGLHQTAGVPDDRVIELHGNATYAHCLDCRARYDLAPIRAAFTRDGTLPQCLLCGGIVKTATISFGQSMPEEAMAAAERATLACDLFLAVGSSLVVYPAAGFPLMAKRNGARLGIINRDPTDLDVAADLVIHHEIGEVMGGLVTVS